MSGFGIQKLLKEHIFAFEHLLLAELTAGSLFHVVELFIELFEVDSGNDLDGDSILVYFNDSGQIILVDTFIDDDEVCDFILLIQFFGLENIGEGFVLYFKDRVEIDVLETFDRESYVILVLGLEEYQAGVFFAMAQDRDDFPLVFLAIGVLVAVGSFIDHVHADLLLFSFFAVDLVQIRVEEIISDVAILFMMRLGFVGRLLDSSFILTLKILLFLFV